MKSYALYKKVSGNCKMAQIQGSFRKSADLRPFLCKFRKVFNTKIVRLGKTSPTMWAQLNRNSFEISMTEIINFSRIVHPNRIRVTGFRNRTLSNTTIFHLKIFRPIFQLVIHILQPRSVPKSELWFENFRPEPIQKFGVLHSSPLI